MPGNYESTDDAFIDARTVQISAQVAAAIVDVPVNDNQLVEAGAELVRLDDRDYHRPARSERRRASTISSRKLPRRRPRSIKPTSRSRRRKRR